MKDFSEMTHFEPSEKVTEVLMQKTQNTDRHFFRIMLAYYFGKLASMMRTNIHTHDRGIIPVNIYALNLASSGHGKGHSTNIVEEQIIHLFKERFLNETFIAVSEKNLNKIGVERANKYQEDPDETVDKVKKEFETLGNLAFSFDSGTTAAVKQMRHKLLMANCGSVNFEMDEIGSNLMGNVEVMNTFLELYDVGKVKQKLTKNTAENKRSEEIDGRTPTNLMLFGTPSKLLDGDKVERELMGLFETGYARRCIFGYHRTSTRVVDKSPEEIYDMLTDTNASDYLGTISAKLGELADMVNYGTVLSMSKEVSMLLIEYRIKCEKFADTLKEHEEILKAEISHRYFKALKIAGAYAFIDGSPEILEEHLYSAIKLVEESGGAFAKILTRERNYVKLAKYIADAGRELTQVDLVEDLPFYKGSESQKKELMALATAYGYKNNIVIKKSYSEGIEFLEGESMEVTDLDSMIISYGTDITEGYKAERAPFKELYKVVTAPGYHYTAHHFTDGYRNSTNLIQGFNTVIIDIDNGVSLNTAKMLLKGYQCLFATTKRHTDIANRYRIIFPLSHTVKMDPNTYSEFMVNVFNWLPFTVDEGTKDCARKWQSHKGQYEYQDGEMLDAMLFIPQTRKEEEQSQKIIDNNSLTNLERWFYLNTNTGNRSNQLIKYALILVDSGYAIEGIRNSLFTFNNKLQDKMSEDEINATIMVTVIKAATLRDSKQRS